MIIPEHEKKQLIEELLPLMHLHHELQEQQVKKLGSYLLREGATHDKVNKPIQAGQYYMWPQTVSVPVNHTRRMRHIIETAQDLEEMNTLLAAHLCKYGKPPTKDINNNSTPSE